MIQKLERDPRIQPGAGLFASVVDWMRRAAIAVNALIDAASPAFFSANRSTDQAIGQGAFVQAVFNAEDEDAAGLLNTTTGQFAATLPGVYQFSGALTITATGGTIGNVQLALYKNGALLKRGPISIAANGTAVALSAAFPPVRLAVGDLVDLRVFVSGSGLTGLAIAGSAGLSWFSGSFIRS